MGSVPLLGYIENTGGGVEESFKTPEKEKRETNNETNNENENNNNNNNFNNSNNNNSHNASNDSPTIKKTFNNFNYNNKKFLEESPISIRSVSSSPYSDVSYLFAGFHGINI